MSDTFPKKINPWLLARHQDSISGYLALVDMPNILASQLRQEGQVEVQLSVAKREDGKTVLSGVLQTEFDLTCQRCLQEMTESFVVDFSLVVVKNEGKLEKLDEDEEAIVCENELSIIPFVEQELILAMPMIAKHSDCEIALHKNTVVEERQQPFADLKDLI